MKLRRIVLLFLLILIPLVVSASAFAQDASPEPTIGVTMSPEATFEVTPEVTPDVPPDVPVDPTPALNRIELINSLVVIIGAIVLLLAGGNTIRESIERAKANKELLDSMEKVALGTIPIGALDKLREIIEIGRSGLELIGTVTDGKPNEADEERG